MEKESWTLLGVWTKYLLVKEIKWELYVKTSDFTRCMDGMRKELEEENKKLRETIKDHQLYEEKLEHRIIEFEELLHWE